MEQNRIKSIVAALASFLNLITLILVITGTLSKWGWSIEQWQSIVAAFLLLAGNIFAFYNNPNNAKSF